MTNKNVDTIGHLTPLQHGMLHHSQREPASGIYVEQFSCLLVGAIDGGRFERAWQSVVQRHDVLKTLFIRLHEEKPMQVVRRQVTLPFVQEDWRDSADPEQRFEQLLADDRARGFDPTQAPLMRIRLIDLGGGRHRFLWTFHHAILDGWSMPVLMDEVFRLYAGAAPLPRPQNDYRHYVAWLRRQDREAARAFWSEHLKGFRKPLRFAPSMMPPAPTPRRLATIAGEMPEAWTKAAQGWCRANRITLSTLCQGAWAALLGLYGDSDDVVHGMVVSGRSSEVAGIETMVGLFINTLPVRVRLDPGQDRVEWLRGLQSLTLDVERHGHSALAEVLQCAELPRTQPLFESIYVFENYPGQAAFREMVAGVGLEVQALRAVEETNYPLALVVMPAGGLRLHLTFDTACFVDAAMAGLLAQYRALLERFVAGDGGRIQDLRLDAAPAPANDAAVEPAGESLLARVADHAARQAPQAAFVGPDSRLDYRELVELAANARRQWQAWSYQPGDRVLLCGDDDGGALALLLAGLEHGIDCLLPDAEVDPDALFAAGAAAWGVEGLQGCVSTGTAPIEVPGLRCDRFDRTAAAELPAAGPGSPARGACSRVHLGADGEWTLLRHDHSQVLRAAAAFARDCPVVEARDVALADSPRAHGNLWTALLALANGLTLRQVGAGGDDDLLRAAAAAGLHWHSLRLGSVATRQLGALARAPRADHWLIDACAVTAEGRRRLLDQGAGSRVLCELRWPAHSLPHAGWHAGEPAFGATASGAVIDIVDRHGHAAVVDARGRLAIVGASVPTALLRGGRTDRAALVWGPAGPRLITGLVAWRTAAGPAAEWPHALAGVASPSRRSRAIEAAVGREPGAGALALVERLTPQREWEHALFHVTAPDAPADESAARLRAACAAHGLADATLVEVQGLPCADRGIDRGALASGDVRTTRRSAIVAPRDEIESALHAIWCELLGRERIGVDEDYFDLGGQSLLASVMLYRIEEKLAVAVGMEMLLEAPTIAGLAHAIRSGSAASGVRVDLAAEAVLGADIVPAAPYRPAPAREILLTGATGFLGVHLLAELLETPDTRVHCLVRADTSASGLQRLAAALQAHGLWRDEMAARIVAVPGELDRPLLGLGEARFDALAREVDAIYHNGAIVNFVYPYRSLKQVNVLATEDVLRLACRHHAKPVHYISTVGVLDRSAAALPESLDVALHDNLVGGYEQSKWVAERLVALAAQRGLPVAIYRPSRIVGHSRTGRMNTDDLFSRLIKGIVTMGLAPRDTGFDNILPVDLASRLIVACAANPEVFGHAVHVVNPRWNSLDAVVDAIEAQGHPVERLDYTSWLARLGEHAKRDPGHPLAALIPVLHKLNPTADPTLARPMPIANEHLARWAPEVLARGLRPVDEWLQAFFDHFHAIGYLPRPAVQSRVSRLAA